MRRDLNIASFSDVHVFHKQTPTRLILDNLTKAFPDDKDTQELDAIFIPGDFFDRPNYLHDGDSILVFDWINRFLRMCSKYNIVVRVLEGTPSHDRTQTSLFDVVARNLETPIDCKVVDTLSIEHVTSLGIDVLYLPDEWKHDHSDIWDDVVDVLNDNGLKQVDYVLMHGMFEYQLPSHLRLDTHRSSKWTKICKRKILCGHIHTSSHFKNILVAGSFDRIAHGEEEAKGHWRIYEKGNDTITKFRVNHTAATYRTIKMGDCSVEDSINKIREFIEPFKDNECVNIRLHYTHGSQGIQGLGEYKEIFSYIRITTKVDEKIGDNDVSLAELDDDEMLANIVQITETNILDNVFMMLDEQGLKISDSNRSKIGELINGIT